jgi:putative FmdB family regulatory protein
MLKIYDFECVECKHVFEALVEGVAGLPSDCPGCGSIAPCFIKCVSSPAIMSTIIPSYPGSKRLKAGYQHTHARAAEKGKSQVSFAGTTKK